MKKVLVIVGTTASGKTALSIKLAKKFGGEVISADSTQVYKYLNIGSDKISKKDMQGVPHHLLDVVHPKEIFTVSDFKNLAEKAIEEIHAGGKLPIITGGTGFYIDAVVNGLNYPEVLPNKKLRKELSKKSAASLFKILNKLDAQRAKSIDPKNKVRLIRAIEIAKVLGKVPGIKKGKSKYKFIKIGLVIPDELLKKRIEKRASEQLKRGLKKEISKLRRLGLTEKRICEFGYVYRDPTIEGLKRGNWHYVKRQKTWWKRDKKIKWFSPSEYPKIVSYLNTLL